MSTPDILGQLLGDHTALRRLLPLWTQALAELTEGGYDQCCQAVFTLRSLCRNLAHALEQHFQQEETQLQPLVEEQTARLRRLWGDLRLEHAIFRRVVEEFQQELERFNSSGELRRLPLVGRDLVFSLRVHLDREENEFYPALAQAVARAEVHQKLPAGIQSRVA
jgi:hemerythrin-like domain-containing protein